MMLIAIAYLSCAAFVLVHLAKAPRIDADGLPDEPPPRPREGIRGEEPKTDEPPKRLPRAF